MKIHTHIVQNLTVQPVGVGVGAPRPRPRPHDYHSISVFHIFPNISIVTHYFYINTWVICLPTFS